MIYRCTQCQYVQDFSPTKKNNEKVFPLIRGNLIKERVLDKHPDAGQCPSCGTMKSLKKQ